MFFRVFCICIVLAAGYALFAIWQIRSAANFLAIPKAGFTVLNDRAAPSLTIVEFLNYGCDPCRQTHRVLLQYAAKNSDVRLVVRPVPYEPDMAETAAEMALAAGLQGKFWELDDALAGYSGDYDEKFYRETAALSELDYDRLVADANGGQVFEFAKNNAGAAIEAGVERTPALLVGKTLYQLDQALTLPDLLRMVQAEKRT